MSKTGILESIVVRDPKILLNEATFRGTRVSVSTLFDYLEGGHTIERFLEGFPSVNREMAAQALEESKDSLLASGQATGGRYQVRYQCIAQRPI